MKPNPGNQIRAKRQRWSAFWQRTGACPRLLSCITNEILVCICLTLPTVWHPPATSRGATLPVSELRFSPVRAPPAPFLLQLVISLSLAYSLTLAFSHSLRYRLAHSSLSLSPHVSHFLLFCSLSRCSTAPSSTFSLSVVAPRGKWRYVNCFLLDGCPACYLSILMNLFPPFFLPHKSSGLRH